jgi:uncharacterized membrane protein YgdD (TMEM256/DUF423 family)
MKEFFAEAMATPHALPRAARLFIVVGAVLAALAVLCGAFGAHALKSRLHADMLAVWHTAVEYHFYHALGLLLVGLITARLPGSAMIRWAGGLILAGVVLFSGSLYALVFMDDRALGAVTPVGGVLLMAAWGLLAAGVVRAK